MIQKSRAPNCNVTVSRNLNFGAKNSWIKILKCHNKKFVKTLDDTKKSLNRILMAVSGGFAVINFIGAISREDFIKGKVSLMYISHQFAIPRSPNSIKDVEDIKRFLFHRLRWLNLNCSLRFKTFSSNYSLIFSYQLLTFTYAPKYFDKQPKVKKVNVAKSQRVVIRYPSLVIFKIQ